MRDGVGDGGGEAMAPYHNVSAKNIKALQNTKTISFGGAINYSRIFAFGDGS
jgi:hypothetical protein